MCSFDKDQSFYFSIKSVKFEKSGGGGGGDGGVALWWWYSDERICDGGTGDNMTSDSKFSLSECANIFVQRRHLIWCV